MKFFIDFEATQPQNEIIAIGVVAEDGDTFRSLVKPQFSKVNNFITELTGLTNEKLENEHTFFYVIIKLKNWINQKAGCWANAEFYAYGDSDELFLKTTIEHLNSTFYELDALGFTSYMCISLKDCSKQIAKYFHRDTVRLIHAFNYIQENEVAQKHDALEDAMMLRKVFEATNGKEPLAADPWREETKRVVEKTEGYNESYGISPANYVFPCGKFYCRNTGKKVKEREFENIEQAINWLIDLHVPKKDRDKVRRNKMAQHIMEAIRKNSTYNGYRWRRIKKG